MEILILNWKDVKNPAKGGAEVIAFEFAKRLVEDGHTVTFFSRSFPGAEPEETIDGVSVVRRGNMLSVYLHAFFYYKSLKVKPEKVIDMVNTICWQTPLYVPKEKRVMYVNQLAKEVFFYELPFPLSWVAYLLERLEYATYTTTKVICYSNSTKDDLQSFGIPKKNIFLFPMGLDHTRYTLGEKKSKEPLFLFVARLVNMKRAARCIEAMHLFIQKNPKAKLIIMGNGPEENTLRMLIKQSNLEKHVTLITKNNFFLKKHSHDSKISFMQQAWALLLPSVKEGWGMVVTEAAACGTPAIVSDVTGLRDSVQKNITGFIVSANPSAKELSQAMEDICEKKTNQRMGKNAISWAKNFDWDTSYQTFRNLLLH